MSEDVGQIIAQLKGRIDELEKKLKEQPAKQSPIFQTINKPDVYDGTMDVDTWLKTMANLCRRIEAQPQQAIDIIMSYVSPTAPRTKAFYEKYITALNEFYMSNGPDPFPTLIDLNRIFLEQFREKDPQGKAIREIDNMGPRKGEWIADYNIRFKNTGDKTGMGEVALKWAYIKSLPRELRDRTYHEGLSPSSTWEQWMAKAAEKDSNDKSWERNSNHEHTFLPRPRTFLPNKPYQSRGTKFYPPANQNARIYNAFSQPRGNQESRRNDAMDVDRARTVSREKAKGECFRCHKKEHFARECTEPLPATQIRATTTQSPGESSNSQPKVEENT